ncbi:lamin tail domain-containing protein [Portibacter lacus]|uniref:T9SS type A sorting domain-containing protein n=1 Tax=Portibacter lacus TaxID=1099794 RepID=A0AA37SQS0_9BACT|nr:lamin tail domain-containing protein [Portibacter lacus]GLR18302.1 hypothetical protein GCM10007940_29180 [Portibacter lacus]
MKKILLLFTLFIGVCAASNAQLVISEIMYNPPESGTDSLEYIEIYNAGDEGVNVNGYSFQQGVEFLFPDTTIASKAYFLLVKDTDAFESAIGINAMEWDAGALSNGGEPIILQDADSMEVNKVDFQTERPWPINSEGAAGGGASIEFCIVESDNSIGENWKASTAASGVFINSLEFKGTPGTANTAMCGSGGDVTVTLSGTAFSPADITINAGETVIWKNEDGFHNVNGSLATFPDNPEGFLSGDAASAPWEFSYTFTKVGVYNYQCDPHSSVGMTGSVTVVNDLPNLVITEIMYNDPSSDDVDSLEFVEVYNAGDSDVFLGGMVFSSNVINYTLPDSTLPAGEFLIIQKMYSGFINDLGLLTIPFTNGGLGNNSDAVTITSADGAVIDYVLYGDSGDWPEIADGLGSSLSLCDVNSDNELASNWQASNTATAREYEDGKFIFANPGALNSCEISIAEASAIDENGVILNEGVSTILEGTVYGINFRPGGLQFTIIDDTNEGIGVFSASSDYGYSVVEGDKIRVEGEIGQFNGLAQVYLDTVHFVSAGNTLIAADTVETLSEMTESSLVTIKDVTLVDPSQWTGTGSGFNVDVTNGTETFALRIDADVADLYGSSYPEGTFNVTGIGGQFDNSDPYLDGYQLFPRYKADIDPFNEFVETFPTKTIGEVTQIDENGVGTAVGSQVQITGVTYGINFRPGGLQFTLIDEDNDGIGLFLNDGDLGYTYNEGDMITVRGSISQFSGLLQINADSILLISSGNDLVEPTVSSELSEDTESQLVVFNSLTVIDPTEWKGDGSTFNVDMETGDGTIVTVRIDADTELAEQSLPGNTLKVTGLGGQFDSSEPYLDGYQLFPRYNDDVVMISGTEELYLDENLVKVYPNPVKSNILFETNIDLEKVVVYNFLGMKVWEGSPAQGVINATSFTAGQYVLHFITADGVVQKELIKI